MGESKFNFRRIIGYLGCSENNELYFNQITMVEVVKEKNEALINQKLMIMKVFLLTN